MPERQIPKLTAKTINTQVIPGEGVSWGSAYWKGREEMSHEHEHAQGGAGHTVSVERTDISVDQESDTVQTIILFDGKVMPMPEYVPLVKRLDFREDGSVSMTYYLEITEDQYRRYIASRR